MPLLRTPLPSPHDAGFSRAEIQLSQAFQKLGPEWSLFVHVPFQGTDNRGNAVAGDIDCMVYHRKHGFLVIEVKGGGIVRSGRTWHSHGSQGQFEIQNPIEQAQKSLYFLSSQLKEWAQPHQQKGACFPPRVDWMVAFPDTASLELGLDLPASRCLLKADMANPEAALLRAFAASALWEHHEPSPIWEDDFLKRLTISEVGPLLRWKMDLEAEGMDTATRSQQAVLDACKLLPRFRVLGRAGSGKTVLAVHKARQWAGEGRTALLCFNRLLAEDIQSRTRACSNLDVGTFHEFARRLLESSGFVWPEKPEATFWASIPDLLIEHLEANPQLRWDAVVVDEAQDFRAEWWVVLEQMLSPTGRRRMALFLDDRQNLQRVEASLPEGLVPLLLERSVRSTRAIAEWIGIQTGLALESEEHVPMGERPLVLEAASVAQAQELLKKQVHRLLVEERLDSSQVLIVTLRSIEHSALQDWSHERCAWSLPPGGLVKGKVNIASVHRAKGLESDVVILIDLTDSTSAELLYTAASRARHRLVVIRGR